MYIKYITEKSNFYGCQFSRQAPAANLDALAKDAFEAIQPAIEALPSLRSQWFRWKKTTVDGSEIPNNRRLDVLKPST